MALSEIRPTAHHGDKQGVTPDQQDLVKNLAARIEGDSETTEDELLRAGISPEIILAAERAVVNKKM